MSNKALAYRPDIDGLRALAVLAVTIFHFNKQWLPGGFVGVDIFFVISGFLITGIVSRQAAAGSFSFADFYMRRVRRILPAALFVTLVTLLFGSIFMLPDDAKALSLSAIASTLSAANIYFWKFLDTSYFAASSDTVPLLHMWSLGVEEQFYLIWPALLLLTLKVGGRAMTVGVAAVIAAACFSYGQSKLAADPTFAYYMLPSRAGELLIGGMTFFMTEAIKGRIGQRAAQLMALMGALVLAWSLAYIRETEGFPGFISIVPAVGASLVLAAGSFSKTLVGKVLAVRPMVSIGLVSFSLYLWHWPVLAFYRYAYGEPDMLGNLICLSVMVAMTLFSYFLIEVPFRANKGWKFTMATPASAALALSFAGVIYASNGIISPISPSDYQDSLAETRSGSAPASSAPYVCQSVYKPEYFSSAKCIAGDTSKPPSVLLIGDSNAAHYAGYLSAIAKNEGVAIRNVEHHACPPFPGQRSARYIKEGYKVSCPAYNAEAFKQISNYDTVIVGGSWPAYEAVDKVAFLADFDAMLDTLSQSGKKIIIALKVPTFNSVDRQCTEKALKIPFINCEQKTVVFDTGENRLNQEIIKRISARANFSYFGVRDLICNGTTCSAFAGKTQLYYDGGHLSREGSEKLGSIAVETGRVPASLSNITQPKLATN
ncbi:acyltransferase [Pseudomonas monteilii]|uniref:acyltransferase family protein n=1 Tax=Pseudomonas TaxID=286 RepID=UPI000484DF87|nr:MULTISPECIES: acyltransferase family protein [Pseudomonas]MBH3453574.1 acyltransferase [Pseudomonas monteilii]PXX65899.1 peptidoglycan/LPS O-acetylase OafA/YrhL [Pseudomonas sp. LAIL14HWK12:I1]SOC97991.1 Peptidoglycan/LPS O-acetylase OafA/YrhL, contains acyltransferase and SGNH-hydrolase domains [Pseudomonas sp. LAIL14HWK12:I3]